MMIKRISILTIILSWFLSAGAIDLTLSQCREMALQNDEDVKIALNHVEQSKLDSKVAKSAYFPKLDANGGTFLLAPNPSMGGMMDLQMRGVYMAGISLTQPIYVGGKIITANKLAKLGREASADQLEMTRMDVIAEAEKSYWMYVAVLSKIEMVKAYMAQIDSIYDFTKTAYDLGMTTRLSLDRVDSRRSEIQYRLKQAEAGADLCRLALCRIIGVEDSEPITPVEGIEGVSRPDVAFSGIEGRPELNLALKNIEAKKLDVKMTLSDFLPTVGMQLGYNAFGNMKMISYTPLPDGSLYPITQKIDYNGFMGALSVSIPLFHWGEGYNKVKKAKMEVENASLSYEKNKKLMELQARQSYSNYITGYDLIESAEKALAEAQANLAAITEQYQLGLMTLTDLLEAQSQWQTAYSNVIEARTQFKINEIEYLRNTGRL